MAGKRKAPAAKKTESTSASLTFEDGYWWLSDGKTKENVGRSRRYAEKMLAERT